MTQQAAKDALIAVLNQVQKRQGLACPTLEGSSVPPKVLPKFDSTVWPVAITLVARKLGVDIPKDVHFGGENGAPLLSIDESAALICKKALPKQPKQQAA